MMTRLLRVALLTTIWVLLWSDLSFANVLSGLLVAGLTVATFDTWRNSRVIVRPAAALRFFGYVAYQMVVSTFIVARTVITPGDRIRRGIVAVPMRGCSDAVVTLIADAISLTPGTLTVEVRRKPLTLYVHALDVRDITVTQHEVRRLETLAVLAFGDTAAIANLAVDDTTVWRSP